MSTRPPSAAQPKRNRTLLIGAVVVILLLGAVLAYYMVDNAQQAEVIEELTLTKTELDAEITQLNQKVDKVDAELMTTKKNLAEKTEEVEQLLRQIKFLKGQVNAYIVQGKLAEQEKEKYKGMYEQLSFYNDRYRKEIASLKQENKLLKERLASAEGKTDSLSKELREKEDEIIQKEIKLEGAQALSAVNFKISAIKRNKKPAEDGKIQARDVRKGIEVCFTVPKNSAALMGEREVVLIMTHESGRTLKGEGSGGYFNYHGRKTAFTSKSILEYNGNSTRHCLKYDHREGTRIKEGMYDIKVLDAGNLMGKSTLTVE